MHVGAWRECESNGRPARCSEIRWPFCGRSRASRSARPPTTRRHRLRARRRSGSRRRRSRVARAPDAAVDAGRRSATCAMASNTGDRESVRSLRAAHAERDARAMASAMRLSRAASGPPREGWSARPGSRTRCRSRPRWRHVIAIADDAADRHRVAQMSVGAQHRRRLPFRRGAALQLLDGRLVVVAEISCRLWCYHRKFAGVAQLVRARVS